MWFHISWRYPWHYLLQFQRSPVYLKPFDLRYGWLYGYRHITTAVSEASMQRSNPSSHGLSRPLFSFQGAALWNIFIISNFSGFVKGFLKKFFLGNFYQSLNLKEVCIIVVCPPGVEPGWPFSQQGLSLLCSHQFHHGHIKWYAYRESNPDACTVGFEPTLSTNSSTGAYKRRPSLSTVLAQYEVSVYSDILRFDLLLEGHKWYARWDLNPQNLEFESSMFASFITGAYKVPFH